MQRDPEHPTETNAPHQAAPSCCPVNLMRQVWESPFQDETALELTLDRLRAREDAS